MAEKLLPASFRGVAFDVEPDGGVTLRTGRSNASHEYVQEDEGWAEDTGGKTRTLAVTAFIIGDRIRERANELLDALEQGGPGELIHPLHGRMQVNVEDVEEVLRSAGEVTYQIAFIESGKAKFEATKVQAQEVSAGIPVLRRNALAEFTERLDRLDAWTQVGLEVLDDVADLGDQVLDIAQRVAGPELLLKTIGRVAALKAQATAAVKTPALLGQAWIAAVQGLADLVLGPPWLDAFGPETASTASTPEDLAIQEARAAQRRLVLLVVAGDVCTAATSTTWSTYEDAAGWATRLAAYLSRAALEATDADLHASLIDLRTRTVQALLVEAAKLPRLRTLRPARVMGAFELAHDLYGDATRALEIIDRNDLPAPAFVGLDPLKVLVS